MEPLWKSQQTNNQKLSVSIIVMLQQTEDSIFSIKRQLDAMFTVTITNTTI